MPPNGELSAAPLAGVVEGTAPRHTLAASKLRLPPTGSPELPERQDAAGGMRALTRASR